MHKRWVVIWTMAFLFIQGTGPYAAGDREGHGKKETDAKIAGILEAAPLKGGIVAISVRSADSGKLLYEQNGNTLLRPASNMKLLTAAAALETLGENARFKTGVYRTGAIQNGTLYGDIYIQGGGDPALLKSDLADWAAELKKQGIRRIQGDLVGDESRYDDTRYSLDLPWSDEQEYYGAQISALTLSPNRDYDAGTAIFEVVPAKKPGMKARIKMVPESGMVKLVNHVRTVRDGEQQEDDIVISRAHGGNTFTASGTITADSAAVRQWKAVWDPAKWVLSVFKKTLEENGITVQGTIKTGRVKDAAVPVLFSQSPPLSSIMVPFLKFSNNTIAEMLVKEMGKTEKGEGSWEKGLEVIRSVAGNFGMDPDQMMLRDGSGISHADLVRANDLTALLYRIQEKDWFPCFFDALPVAGAENRLEGGTLRNRFKGTAARGQVFAKTGSITGVSTLSGYMQVTSGEKLIFSILINNVLDEEAVHQAEEQIVLQFINQGGKG